MKVRDLPKISKEVTLDQIGEFLFDKGVSSNSIENLKGIIDDLQMIARWYDNDSNLEPSEFETEAYLIIPILRKLGWTPQKMALEYKSEKERGKRIDIALFSNLPRSMNLGNRKLDNFFYILYFSLIIYNTCNYFNKSHNL